MAPRGGRGGGRGGGSSSSSCDNCNLPIYSSSPGLDYPPVAAGFAFAVLVAIGMLVLWGLCFKCKKVHMVGQKKPTRFGLRQAINFLFIGQIIYIVSFALLAESNGLTRSFYIVYPINLFFLDIGEMILNYAMFMFISIRLAAINGPGGFAGVMSKSALGMALLMTTLSLAHVGIRGRLTALMINPGSGSSDELFTMFDAFRGLTLAMNVLYLLTTPLLFTAALRLLFAHRRAGKGTKIALFLLIATPVYFYKYLATTAVVVANTYTGSLSSTYVAVANAWTADIPTVIVLTLLVAAALCKEFAWDQRTGEHGGVQVVGGAAPPGVIPQQQQVQPQQMQVPMQQQHQTMGQGATYFAPHPQQQQQQAPYDKLYGHTVSVSTPSSGYTAVPVHNGQPLVPQAYQQFTPPSAAVVAAHPPQHQQHQQHGAAPVVPASVSPVYVQHPQHAVQLPANSTSPAPQQQKQHGVYGGTPPWSVAGQGQQQSTQFQQSTQQFQQGVQYPGYQAYSPPPPPPAPR